MRMQLRSSEMPQLAGRRTQRIHSSEFVERSINIEAVSVLMVNGTLRADICVSSRSWQTLSARSKKDGYMSPQNYRAEFSLLQRTKAACFLGSKTLNGGQDHERRSPPE
jgi:hypothetical protein